MRTEAETLFYKMLDQGYLRPEIAESLREVNECSPIEGVDELIEDIESPDYMPNFWRCHSGGDMSIDTMLTLAKGFASGPPRMESPVPRPLMKNC